MTTSVTYCGNKMSSAWQISRELYAATILANRYIKHKPTLKQEEFLQLNVFEALYGGAAGGGKSDALLMGGLQYVDVPGYSAIIFRRSYTDLCKSGALIDRSHEWLDNTDAVWDGKNHIWVFPSGAKLAFGYLENDSDVYHHQSAEYQFLGFDELTQFSEFQYRYMLSRVRRLQNFPVPLRVRAATNPTSITVSQGKTRVYGAWVKQWFIVEGAQNGRIFVPAKLTDNPYLDQQKYTESLSLLDPITRQQLLYGDWDVTFAGGQFQASWFLRCRLADVPVDAVKVRFWDFAATPATQNINSDYTVGVLMAQKASVFYVLNVQRTRGSPREIENLVRRTAEADGLDVEVYCEMEPGSSGKIVVDHYLRNVLCGYAFRGVKSSGSKEARAKPFSAAAEAGNVYLIEAPWNTAFLDELALFPFCEHDDQVDAAAGAFNALTMKRRPLGLIGFGEGGN